VLRVGSLDKLAWAGLRIGWICGPRELIGRLARMKAAHDLGSGVLGQLAALALLRDVDALRIARVAQARHRAALLRDELTRRIPAWRIAPPEGGWSLWAEWDAETGVDGDALAAAAAGHGVHVAAGRPHFPAADAGRSGPRSAAVGGLGVAGGSAGRSAAVDGDRVAAVRIAYAADDPALVEGVARLSAVWADLSG
jgi:DNA-binding transcriptional MocR family regulator